MTSDPPDGEHPTLDTPRYGRVFFVINAAAAWFGVVVSFTLNTTGYYVAEADPAKSTILGNVPGGIDATGERFLDWITYFTILSNIVVAVVLTALVVRPSVFARRDAVGTVWRTLRLDSVLMIVITGIVYNLLLAEGGKSGWDLTSNTMLHIATPLITLVVWIIAGPRGLINRRVIGLALVLPLLWAAFALVRGQVVGAYPYLFLDVGTNGLASVLAFIGVIVLIAVLLSLVLLAIDAALRATARFGTAAAGPGTGREDSPT
jgi:hypothetical protein